MARIISETNWQLWCRRICTHIHTHTHTKISRPSANVYFLQVFLCVRSCQVEKPSEDIGGGGRRRVSGELTKCLGTTQSAIFCIHLH